MVQTVRVTVRWKEPDGNVLGAVRERELNLPGWGKKGPMRREITNFVNSLINESKAYPEQPQNFAGYAFKAFRTGNIIQIKAKTIGSFINLKGNELESFLKENGL